MDIHFNTVITVTDTEQTWVVCNLCAEPYRHEPAGGLSVPEVCEVCENDLQMEEAKTGFWFSLEDESEMHGPFDSEEKAKARAISYVSLGDAQLAVSEGNVKRLFGVQG